MFGVGILVAVGFYLPVASCTAANPIGKAVELLDVLKAQLEADMKADGDTYFNFAQWATNETTTAKRIISETKQSVIELTTSIDEEQAQRAGMTRDHGKAIAELTRSEQELSVTRNLRIGERKDYERQEVVFTDSIDQLSRSTDVLAKKFQQQSIPSGNLLTIATTLRTTLEQGSDLQLSARQRETLDQFVRVSQVSRPRSNQQLLAVDFLQVKQHRKDPSSEFGTYDSQTDGVVATLETVLQKTKAAREEANTQEETAGRVFRKFEEQLQKQIKSTTQRKTNLESQISTSQQQQAQMQADLLAARKLLKSTLHHLQAVQQEFTSKTRSYKDRAMKRSDETIAVGEAIRVLTSESSKMLVSKQSIGTAAFFQLVSETRGKAVSVIRVATTPGLALLALRSHTRLKSWSESGDPFEKVKSMIRDMLDRLQTQSNQEAEHHSWCDSEMSKTSSSRDDKQNDVQKLADRLDANINEITKLKDEIEQAMADLTAMRESMAAATKIRVEEETNAAKSLKQYQDAQLLLSHALEVLKSVYNSRSHDDMASIDGSSEATGENNREGLGGGVVAILEIAQADFADLERSSEAEEKKSAEMYKEMMNELQIQIAIFRKDIEYKTRAKVKLEAEEARNNADKDSYDKELSAITDYIDKLKGDCVAKAEPYEERKARREQELAALNDSLRFLNGESLA